MEKAGGRVGRGARHDQREKGSFIQSIAGSLMQTTLYRLMLATKETTKIFMNIF